MPTQASGAAGHQHSSDRSLPSLLAARYSLLWTIAVRIFLLFQAEAKLGPVFAPENVFR
jgi:hypothetical protein